MPSKSPSQRKAAGAELARRKNGTKRQKKATRPFGSAKLKDIRDFARG